jgi:hypothetical protein
MYEWCLKIIKPFFPEAIIYKNEEIIFIKKINLYFLLHDVKCNRDFDCKIIAYMSRPAHKGTPIYWQNYILRGLNSYFKQTWSKEDMSLIYTKLGNDVNRKLCMKFISSGFDLVFIKNYER